MVFSVQLGRGVRARKLTFSVFITLGRGVRVRIIFSFSLPAQCLNAKQKVNFPALNSPAGTAGQVAEREPEVEFLFSVKALGR